MDEGQILQVLRNLVSNALKVSPEGSTIMLGMQPPAETAVFEVHDEDPDIPQGKHIWITPLRPVKDSLDPIRLACVWL